MKPGNISLRGLPLLFVLAGLLLFSLAGIGGAEQSIQAMRSVEVITVDDSGQSIRFPSGISYDRDGDEIYVTSPQRNKLVVFTSDYFPYLSISSGRGLNSISKTYIKNNLLYVCVGATNDGERPHIAVLDMAFMPVQKIFFPDFDTFSPLDLVVGETGNLYVVGVNGTGVMVIGTDGNFLRWIEPKDEVLGVAEEATISAIDAGRDGNLYLLSEGMGRVYVYDQNERFLRKFGQKGGQAGTLSRPRGIAVDDDRRQVYLVDYQRHTLSVYAQNGEYLFEFGGLGSGRGWFYYPSDLVVDGRGRVIVADTFNHRIQVFDFISSQGFGVQEGAAIPVKADAEPSEVTTDVPVNFVQFRRLKDDLQFAQMGDFLVLTAMTKKRQDAEQLQKQLVRKGYPAEVREIVRDKSGSWHQVLVGPYLEPLAAYRIAERLRNDEQLPAMLKTRAGEIQLEIPAETSDNGTGGPVVPLESTPIPEILPPQDEIPVIDSKGPQSHLLPLPKSTALPAVPLATIFRQQGLCPKCSLAV